MIAAGGLKRARQWKSANVWQLASSMQPTPRVAEIELIPRQDKVDDDGWVRPYARVEVARAGEATPD